MELVLEPYITRPQLIHLSSFQGNLTQGNTSVFPAETASSDPKLGGRSEEDNRALPIIDPHNVREGVIYSSL